MALKKLASQTAIYGIPSILGRFLNYLLVPLYTGAFIPAEYGVVNDLYAVAAFLAIFLLFGLETAFFKFSNKAEYSSDAVFSSALRMVGGGVLLFVAINVLFTDEVSRFMMYPDHPEYILYMTGILAFDALSALPLARLRQQNKALQFAFINFSNIGVNILLNLVFILPLTPGFSDSWLASLEWSTPKLGITYIFIANFAASAVRLILCLPAFKALFHTGENIYKPLLVYGLPLMVAGFAGIVNETLDRRLLRIILDPEIGETAALAQVGIYSACYKLAIIISLFNQAFRYAADPFFFSQERRVGSKNVYAAVMHVYTAIACIVFLFVLFYLDFFKEFIRNESYWEGLTVVPILMVANIFLGWYFNLSVWYKLTEKTRYGMYFSIFGAVLTIGLNIWLIPKISYVGSAWATLAAYGSMAILSYLFGRKHYQIPYNIFKILGYLALAVGFYSLHAWIDLHLLIRSFLLLLFIAFVALLERKTIQNFAA